ncbi:MAG: RNA polymerase sigma factor [Isosphaerales bacterium]
MASGRPVSVGEGLRTLWAAGAIGAADDAVLIARFSERRDEVAEAAFRVLVERHGPMVVRVCRQVIGNGHAAEEAAQAVFLVLARKAGSIRVRTTVAPWLYGVSRRVAARARARAAARTSRDARTARVLLAGRVDADTTGAPHEGDWEAVHEEVGRLPERYRTPVVLCYLEGQTYEEAARRIGCPVGTVRVRLSRARDRLRDRLTRRGFGPERVTAVGCLVDGAASARPASGAGAGWVDATVKASQAYAAGRAAAAGMVPALALALGDEVVRSLAMSQWKLVMFALAALGATSAAAIGLAVGGGSQERPTPGRGGAPDATAQAAPEKKVTPPAVKDLPEPVEVMLPKQAKRLLAMARQRVDAQRAFYEEGRLTIDRYIQALQLLNAAEMEQAPTRQGRIIAAQTHVERTVQLLKREQDELKVGRGTIADVAEAGLANEQAIAELLKAHKAPGPGDVEVLQKRVETLEKQLERVIKLMEQRGIDIRSRR